MNTTSYAIVDKFEKTIAKYAGAKYGVAVESCCAAIFLSLKYQRPSVAMLPRYTYPGVACSVINSGWKLTVDFTRKWSGWYIIGNTNVVDSALRFKKGMYRKGSFYCLSFHAKKNLPIGRGGMILTDNRQARDWFRKSRFDGRSEVPLNKDKIKMIGWNMYMTPEQAARGLMIFDMIKDKDLPDINWKSQHYPDLSKIKAYQ